MICPSKTCGGKGVGKAPLPCPARLPFEGEGSSAQRWVIQGASASQAQVRGPVPGPAGRLQN